MSSRENLPFYSRGNVMDPEAQFPMNAFATTPSSDLGSDQASNQPNQGKPLTAARVRTCCIKVCKDLPAIVGVIIVVSVMGLLAAIFLSYFVYMIIEVCILMVSDMLGSLQSSPKDPVYITILFQSSVATTHAMAAAVAAFNSANRRLPSGRIVAVDLRTLPTTSLSYTLQPDIYSPMSAYWVEKEMAVSSVDKQCKTLTSMPLGVAMWREMAQALGWPHEPISFHQIMGIAADPKGWASLAPEYAGWGRLKYGHGHPQFSDSGRHNIIAAIYSQQWNATDGRVVPLTNTTIRDNDARAAITRLEEMTYHLGRSDNELLTQTLAHGKGYLHAIFTYESTLISYNQQNGQNLTLNYGDDLVFIYPSDGTFWVESPVCVLDKPPWAPNTAASDEKQDAAQMFVDFLTSDGQQAELPKYGVRPRDPQRDISGAGSIIWPENGALPTSNVENTHRLPNPTQEMMDEVLAIWHQVKKPAIVEDLLDNSSNMATSNSTETTKENLNGFNGP